MTTSLVFELTKYFRDLITFASGYKHNHMIYTNNPHGLLYLVPRNINIISIKSRNYEFKLSMKDSTCHRLYIIYFYLLSLSYMYNKQCGRVAIGLLPCLRTERLLFFFFFFFFFGGGGGVTGKAATDLRLPRLVGTCSISRNDIFPRTFLFAKVSNKSCQSCNRRVLNLLLFQSDDVQV